MSLPQRHSPPLVVLSVLAERKESQPSKSEHVTLKLSWSGLNDEQQTLAVFSSGQGTYGDGDMNITTYAIYNNPLPASSSMLIRYTHLALHCACLAFARAD